MDTQHPFCFVKELIHSLIICWTSLPSNQAHHSNSINFPHGHINMLSSFLELGGKYIDKYCAANTANRDYPNYKLTIKQVVLLLWHNFMQDSSKAVSTVLCSCYQLVVKTATCCIPEHWEFKPCFFFFIHLSFIFVSYKNICILMTERERENTSEFFLSEYQNTQKFYDFARELRICCNDSSRCYFVFGSSFRFPSWN